MRFFMIIFILSHLFGCDREDFDQRNSIEQDKNRSTRNNHHSKEQNQKPSTDGIGKQKIATSMMSPPFGSSDTLPASTSIPETPKLPNATDFANGSSTSHAENSMGSSNGSNKPIDYVTSVKPLIKMHCLKCHDSSKATGGIDLERVNISSFKPGSIFWQRVLAAVQGKEGTSLMPPGENLNSQKISLLLNWQANGFPFGAENKTPLSDSLPEPWVETDFDEPFASGLEKLSRFQMYNALHRIFADSYEGRRVIPDSAMQFLPSGSSLSGDFDTSAHIIGKKFINDLLFAAGAVAASVGEKIELRESFRAKAFQTCFKFATKNTKIADSCIKESIKFMLQRAFRRGPSEAETKRYFDLYLKTRPDTRLISDAVTGIKATISAVVLSPHFLFRVNTTGTFKSASEKVVLLSGIEIANRLAYFTTGEQPDNALLASVDSLQNPETIKREFLRLMAGSLAKRNTKHFTRQWLKLWRVSFGGFSETFRDAVDTDGYTVASRSRPLVPGAVNEVTLFIEEFMHEHRPFSFLYDGDVLDVSDEKAFGSLNLWYEGAADRSPQPQEYLSGILNRPAVRWQMGDMGNPMRLGAEIRRRFLCEDLHFPDLDDVDGEDIKSPPKDPHLNSRERYESITNSDDCQTCHAKINAAGFALLDKDPAGFSRYDPAHTQGQENTLPLEAIFGEIDGTYSVVNWLPVNTQVSPFIDSPQDVPVTGTNGFQAALANSWKAKECFVRQRVFRFGLGRRVASDDIGLLKELTEFLHSGGSVKDMLVRAVMSEQFRQKQIKN